MPSSQTITSSNFLEFSPKQLIKSAEVNGNFSVFRGHIIPVNTDTSSSSDMTHVLGASDHRWKNLYGSPILNATLPSAPVARELGWNNTTNKPQVYNGTAWEDLGSSGSGELNFDDKGDSENAVVGDFSTGNNATFDGGGTLAGTFSISTSASDLIRGTSTFKYVQSGTAGDNDDDYISRDPIDIPQGYRGRFLGLKFQYRFDGTSGNIKWVVKDTTNGTILTDASNTIDQYIDSSNNTSKEFTLAFYCPPSCTQIEFGPQVITGEASKVLTWDDVVVTPNPFVYKDLSPDTEWADYTPTTQGLDSPTIDYARWRRDGPDLLLDIKITAGTTPSGDELQVGLPTGLAVSSGQTANPASVGARYRYSTETAHGGPVLATAGDTFVNFGNNNTFGNGSANPSTPITGTQAAASGETFHFWARVPIQGWTTTTENVVHHSSGTENVFSGLFDGSAGASVSIVSQSSSDNPFASVSQSATGVFDITLKSGFFSVAPSVAVTAKTLGVFASATSVSTAAIQVKLITDGGSVPDDDFYVTVQRQGSDYKNPQAFAITPLTRTVYLKDVKSAGTAGGTATAGGGFETRTLNTMSPANGYGFVSLSSNQFTLQTGKYEIWAQAPGHRANSHIAKLRNITDSSDEIIGSSGYNDPSVGVSNSYSTIIGSIDISSAKTYEIQHLVQATRADDGFGQEANLGVSEVYTQVKITKLK